MIPKGVECRYIWKFLLNTFQGLARFLFAWILLYFYLQTYSLVIWKMNPCDVCTLVFGLCTLYNVCFTFLFFFYFLSFDIASQTKLNNSNMTLLANTLDICLYTLYVFLCRTEQSSGNNFCKFNTTHEFAK